MPPKKRKSQHDLAERSDQTQSQAPAKSHSPPVTRKSSKRVTIQDGPPEASKVPEVKRETSPVAQDDGFNALLQPIYQGTKFFGDGNCERLFLNGLCLPSGSNLTDYEFKRIIKVLEQIFKLN